MSDTIKIKIITPIFVNGESCSVGDVVEIERRDAQSLIGSQQAVSMETANHAQGVVSENSVSQENFDAVLVPLIGEFKNVQKVVDAVAKKSLTKKERASIDDDQSEFDKQYQKLLSDVERIKSDMEFVLNKIKTYKSD